MKYILLTAILISLLFSQSQAKPCPDDSEHFSINFEEIDISSVFAVIADFRGLELKVDESISGSTTVKFKCVHWQTFAEDMAAKHNLEVLVINDSLHVSKR